MSYEDLEPLFGTAAKKIGTRIAVVLVLGVMIENGQEKNDQIEAFITSVKADNNPLLSSEAHQI